MAKYTTIEEYVAAQPSQLQEVCRTLIPLIDAALPGTGALWQGHPVWSLGARPGQRPVCLLKAYASYVTFGFWRGQELCDSRIDTSTGMAHVKLRTPTDIDADLFGEWLKQARELEANA
jgi:hypothetical protein